MGLHDRGQSGLRLHRRREGRTVPPRCGLAVSAQRHIDDARIERLDVLVTKPESRKRTGPKILDDDVGLAAEPADDLAGLGIVQIEAQVPFSRVLLHVIEPDAVDIGQADATEIARRRLDLGDVGAEIAQRFRAMRSSEHAREVDDAQSLQWRGGHDQSPSKTAVAGPVAKNASAPRCRSLACQIMSLIST